MERGEEREGYRERQTERERDRERKKKIYSERGRRQKKV